MMRQQTRCLKVCKLWRLWVKPAIFSTPHPPPNFRELIFISIFSIVMTSTMRTTMMFLVSTVVSLLPKNLLHFRELQSLLKACISSAALDSFIKMCTFNKSGHVEQSTSSNKINGFYWHHQTPLLTWYFAPKKPSSHQQLPLKKTNAILSLSSALHSCQPSFFAEWLKRFGNNTAGPQTKAPIS